MLSAHRFSDIRRGCSSDGLMDFYIKWDGMFVLMFQGNSLLPYSQGDCLLVRWMQKCLERRNVLNV
jgi:hypothetical protein